MQDTNYISIPEAVELTGKNHSTLSRFANKYAKTDHVKKEGNAWLIDRAFLLTHYVALQSAQSAERTNAKQEKKEPPKQDPQPYQDLIHSLQDEVGFLRKQLDRKEKQIENFQVILANRDRLLESNTEPKVTQSDTPTREDSSSKIIWVVLAFVFLSLLLSIVFVDELRELAQ